MKLRIASVIVALAFIAALVTLQLGAWGPSNKGLEGYYDTAFKLNTQAQYDKFMSTIYGKVSAGTASIDNISCKGTDCWPLDYTGTKDRMTNPPATTPPLPVTIKFTVYTDTPLGYGQAFFIPARDRTIISIILIMVGIGLTGILWMLPSGIYDKPKLQVTKRCR